MKRLFILSIAIILFISAFTSIAYANFSDTDLLYNNVNSATVNASVSTTGKLNSCTFDLAVLSNDEWHNYNNVIHINILNSEEN